LVLELGKAVQGPTHHGCELKREEKHRIQSADSSANCLLDLLPAAMLHMPLVCQKLPNLRQIYDAVSENPAMFVLRPNPNTHCHLHCMCPTLWQKAEHRWPTLYLPCREGTAGACLHRSATCTPGCFRRPETVRPRLRPETTSWCPGLRDCLKSRVSPSEPAHGMALFD